MTITLKRVDRSHCAKLNDVGSQVACEQGLDEEPRELVDDIVKTARPEHAGPLYREPLV